MILSFSEYSIFRELFNGLGHTKKYTFTDVNADYWIDVPTMMITTFRMQKNFYLSTKIGWFKKIEQHVTLQLQPMRSQELIWSIAI